jgi:hypothetical protein
MLNLLSDIWYGLFYRADKFSHTKMWSNVGYSVFTWAIITKVINNTASDELFLIYISVTALHTTASSVLSKYNFKGKQNDDSA